MVAGFGWFRGQRPRSQSDWQFHPKGLNTHGQQVVKEQIGRKTHEQERAYMGLPGIANEKFRNREFFGTLITNGISRDLFPLRSRLHGRTDRENRIRCCGRQCGAE
jgi:hypothetical protein